MRIIFSIIVSFFFFASFSQSKYWVVLDEEKCGKCVDQFSIWLNNEGVEVANQSKWLHAVSVVVEEQYLSKIKNHEWVVTTTLVPSYEINTYESGDGKVEFVDVLEQVNAFAFANAGIDGTGVKVGVIDAGFVDVDSNEFFKHLHERGGIVAVRDFIELERTDFYTKKTAGCTHGREVLKRITGIDQSKNLVYGMANGANFYLARTENGDKEERVEEDNWVAAIEWMYENGVRLVNTSLGYGNDFDDPNENYITRQMDGNTAMITKAAQIAVRDKGMIIVVSAGNNGRKEWQIVTAPGDCKEVITIGATSKTSFSKIGYSSIGADFVNYIKPDVSCYSPSGTSYSAPIITGMVACMLQIDSTLTSEQVKSYLSQASHLYPFANNYLGYGVPNSQKVMDLIKGEKIKSSYKVENANGEVELSVELPKETETVVLFHKSDQWKVLRQEVEKVTVSKSSKRSSEPQLFYKEDGKLYMKIYRLPDYNYTTLQAGEELIEIKW